MMTIVHSPHDGILMSSHRLMQIRDESYEQKRKSTGGQALHLNASLLAVV